MADTELVVERNFMENPLVIWVDTFRENNSSPLRYRDLYGGVFVNRVMNQIDPRPVYNNINTDLEDENGRIQNWENLSKNVQAYYQEVLQQLLIMRLPNIHAICREPKKDSSFEELKKMLLLILGCAVQCERKEHFIEKIKELDINVQHAVVDHIREVTDDSQAVLSTEPPEQMDAHIEKMYSHLTKLINERNDISELLTELTQERDYYQSQAERQSMPLIPRANSEKHHLLVELADSKAKLRHLRQELEDKMEALSDLEDDLDEAKATINKLKNENMELSQDARTARTYRDENDMLREKAMKVDNYENEISKFKEKLNELDFFKMRVEELCEDKNILLETRAMLEDQLASSHKRVETVVQLENELMKYRQQLEMSDFKEQDAVRQKMLVLMEENARLTFEKKTSMNQNTTMELELEVQKNLFGVGGSLSDQLNETSSAELLKLELENRRLLQKLEAQEESALIEKSAMNLELKKENQRLSKKVESLQEVVETHSQDCMDAEQRCQKVIQEKEKLSQAMETVKENVERQVKEFEREKEHLEQTVETLRERNEKSNDAKLKDLEKENAKLHTSVSKMTTQVSELEFENKQLQKSYQKLKENDNRILELENSNSKFMRCNSDLKNAVEAMRLTCRKYENVEQECSRLEVENSKFQKTIESLQASLSKSELLEEQFINLNVEKQKLQKTVDVENQKLQKTMDFLKSSSEKVLELEHDKDLQNTEIQQLKKILELQRMDRRKYEQMEMDILDMDNENQKNQKSLEIATRRLHQLEQDNNDLEIENEKLQKTVESLKLLLKKLEEKEKENSELEDEVAKLHKEKSSLEKENKKLKNSVELKEITLDDVNSKLSALDREYRNMKKVMERNKDINEKLREMEKEKTYLLQQFSVNQKTVVALREDLVKEKIQTQQLNNELEKLSEELAKIGLNKEQLMVEHSQDESRIKVLEGLFEEALKKKMEIREQKIHALESRLDESKNRNLKLQNELIVVGRECESVKQRFEEECCVRERFPSPAKEILELKDHLVKVERANASLMTENQNLKTQAGKLNEQVQKLESQTQISQHQSSSLQQHYNTLQSQNAKLQVENKTLQSEHTSLMSQNSTLQLQLHNLESEQEHLLQSYEELQASHDSLISNHNELIQLHEKLASDHESLFSDCGLQKATCKLLKNELRDHQDQVGTLLHSKKEVGELRGLLEANRKSLNNLQEDYNCLQNDHDSLQSAHAKLSADHKDLIAEHKQLKTNYNHLQLSHTEVKGELRSSQDKINMMDVSLIKLTCRCEAFDQINQKLEEENRILLHQMEALITQNQELLTQALNSKDHFVEEERVYLEKLSDLRRQKERLEEKIMEHYKMQRESQKKRGFGAILARKARGIITRAQRSKSKQNLSVSDSPDSSSVGSGCHESLDGNSNSGRRLENPVWRRNSSEPVLANQNKSLAKSTSTLLFPSKHQDTANSLRGAKSIDDLACEEHGDKRGHNYLIGLEKPSGVAFQPASPVRSMSKRRSSPGSEMLTMQQFLNEANNSPPARKKFLETTNSDVLQKGSKVDECQESYLHAPFPGGDQGTSSPQSNSPSYYYSSMHRLVSPQDLDASRISRISSESAGSSSEGQQDGNYSYHHSVMSNTNSIPRASDELGNHLKVKSVQRSTERYLQQVKAEKRRAGLSVEPDPLQSLSKFQYSAASKRLQPGESTKPNSLEESLNPNYFSNHPGSLMKRSGSKERVNNDNLERPPSSQDKYSPGQMQTLTNQDGPISFSSLDSTKFTAVKPLTRTVSPFHKKDLDLVSHYNTGQNTLRADWRYQVHSKPLDSSVGPRWPAPSNTTSSPEYRPLPKSSLPDRPHSVANSGLEMREREEGVYSRRPSSRGPPPVPAPKPSIRRDTHFRASSTREPPQQQPPPPTGQASSLMPNVTSKTPTARISPQTKTTHKMPVPKPEEQKASKENSVWYEYGCV